ncbi:MAG: CopG family transcriptional regulator [Deltaproteobacteria bacterium]|nr:CopG family transcriptional regulator [Deltaproteobacteria bacterium]
MVRTQIYLPEEELAALHAASRRSGKTVAQLVREAVREVWGRPSPRPTVVALWRGVARRSWAVHDSMYDER